MEAKQSKKYDVREHFFPNVSTKKRGKLMLDEVAMYSVTDQRTADAISRRLLAFIPKSSTITNATSCVGGNTWSFSKHFDRVVAIERDPTRFKYLVHNMNVLGAKNVHIINGDAISILLSPPQQKQKLSMVFMDPPWGGPDYKKFAKLSLFLSGEPLSNFINRLAKISKYIALKVPVNFDIDALKQDVARNAKVVLYDKFKKMHLIVLGSFPQWES